MISSPFQKILLKNLFSDADFLRRAKKAQVARLKEQLSQQSILKSQTNFEQIDELEQKMRNRQE